MWLYLGIIIFCMCYDFSLEFFVVLLIILGVEIAYAFWMCIREGLDKLKDDEKE